MDGGHGDGGDGGPTRTMVPARTLPPLATPSSSHKLKTKLNPTSPGPAGRLSRHGPTLDQPFSPQ